MCPLDNIGQVQEEWGAVLLKWMEHFKVLGRIAEMEKCLHFLKNENFVKAWMQGLSLFELEKKAELAMDPPENIR